MASSARRWIFSRALLYPLFVVFCPLCHTQQPAAGIAQTAQTESGADASQSRGSTDEQLSGLAVIVKVASIAGDPLFDADGYRIRVQPGTVTAFSGSLNTLVDVVPGTWIHFDGARDNTGVILARRAEFFPPGTRKSLTAMGPTKAKQAPDYQPVTRDSLLDANGRLVNPHTKVRLSDAGGPCGWHRVPADPPLQERVERIGIGLVPAFQKQLPHGSPSRIPFRFYVVADGKVRSAFTCNFGLVLVPRNVVERLQNDDQLAAVLADPVAFNLQRQLVTTSALDLVADGAEIAATISLPAGYIAGEAIEGIVDHETEVRLQREIARIALQLLAESGYDPWQAPEAWRLLSPKEAPQDVRSVAYTPEGNYQLSILKLQYSGDNPDSLKTSPPSAAGNSVQ